MGLGHVGGGTGEGGDEEGNAASEGYEVRYYEVDGRLG